MKKFISILLVLVMLFSACSNAFAIDKLDTETVKGQIMAYYDANETTIKDILKSAAGDYAFLIDSPACDIRASLENYVNANIEGICAYMENICASSASEAEKTADIAEYMTNALIEIFNTMLTVFGISVTAELESIISSFAAGYAPTIVDQYRPQLGLATILSDNPMFFFFFSLVELVAIIALIVALGKKKNATK